MLCSFRSFLVPNPYLHASCSGNSKVPYLFPQDRGSSQLLLFFFPHTDILGNYPCAYQFQSPSFSAASQGLWIHVFLPHLFLLSGVWIIQSMWQEGQSYGEGIVMLGDGAVPGLRWKDNCRLDWWLLDTQTCYQSCITLLFFSGSEGHCLKTSKISGLGGCDVPKPYALHLNKVMSSTWLQGLEHFSN